MRDRRDFFLSETFLASRTSTRWPPTGTLEMALRAETPVAFLPKRGAAACAATEDASM